MTSSENEEGTLSTSDEQTVALAKESLTTVLQKDRCTPKDISTALEYLTELKNRIAEVGERRPALLHEYERYSRTCEATRSRQERLDQDIIDTKLRVSELLSERDSIARDLARAKRALNEADESPHTPISGSTNDADIKISTAHNNTGMNGTRATRTNRENGETSSENDVFHEQHDIDALQRSVHSEMERLRLAEEQLIDVVDEINSAKKKRTELQEKVKAAQEEW